MNYAPFTPMPTIPKRTPEEEKEINEKWNPFVEEYVKENNLKEVKSQRERGYTHFITPDNNVLRLNISSKTFPPLFETVSESIKHSILLFNKIVTGYNLNTNDEKLNKEIEEIDNRAELDVDNFKDGVIQILPMFNEEKNI